MPFQRIEGNSGNGLGRTGGTALMGMTREASDLSISEGGSEAHKMSAPTGEVGRKSRPHRRCHSVQSCQIKHARKRHKLPSS